MVILKRSPVHYRFPVKVFVPVFQKDFDQEGLLLSSPTFEYRYADATQDEQLAWSMEPDHVLELTGMFDATTKSITFSENEK